jgi:hypothetical protein
MFMAMVALPRAIERLRRGLPTDQARAPRAPEIM